MNERQKFKQYPKKIPQQNPLNGLHKQILAAKDETAERATKVLCNILRHSAAKTVVPIHIYKLSQQRRKIAKRVAQQTLAVEDETAEQTDKKKGGAIFLEENIKK